MIDINAGKPRTELRKSRKIVPGHLEINGMQHALRLTLAAAAVAVVAVASARAQTEFEQQRSKIRGMNLQRASAVQQEGLYQSLMKGASGDATRKRQELAAIKERMHNFGCDAAQWIPTIFDRLVDDECDRLRAEERKVRSETYRAEQRVRDYGSKVRLYGSKVRSLQAALHEEIGNYFANLLLEDIMTSTPQPGDKGVTPSTERDIRAPVTGGKVRATTPSRTKTKSPTQRRTTIRKTPQKSHSRVNSAIEDTARRLQRQQGLSGGGTRLRTR